MVIDPSDATDVTHAPDDAGAAGRRPVTGRVALVSSGEYAHLDEDLPPIVAELAARGVDVIVADWHDDGFAWEGVDLAVIRSTWDYTWQLDSFLAWVDRASALTLLVNPARVVRWNTDKRYLLDLAAAGVPTVPTRIVAPADDPAGVDDLARDRQVVVKPVVSAGARDTERYGPDQLAEARAHVERLQGEGRSVLVQPYLDGIDGHGETGMVFLGDSFSHAFRKGPILVPGNGFVDGLYRGEDIGPRTASQAELDVASAALDAVPAGVPGMSRRDLLYARVDVAPHDREPVVLELELVEPSFFCATDSGAAERAAEAVAAALTS